MIIKALKYLTSKDKTVNHIAWDQLRATVCKRTGRDPEYCTDVLNTPPPRNEASRRDVRSLWSMVRKSLAHLNIKLDFDEEGFIVRLGDSQVRTTRWRPVADLMKHAKEERRLQQVLSCSDQGRSYHAISLHPASSNYVSFAEYKFALQARLNLLPVKTVAKRLRRVRDTTCPKCCSQPESLGHVSNACTPNPVTSLGHQQRRKRPVC